MELRCGGFPSRIITKGYFPSLPISTISTFTKFKRGMKSETAGPNGAEQAIEIGRAEIRLKELNGCSPESALERFMRCCGSTKWAHRMVKARPFARITELEDAADRLWATCSREDWLEAFSAHPVIGRQSQNRWSQQEQSGVSTSPPEFRAAFADAHIRYEAKFGYIFIICAAGKTVIEILTALTERLNHDPQTEIQFAAEQQRLITRLRLRKLLSD